MQIKVVAEKIIYYLHLQNKIKSVYNRYKYVYY